MGKAGYSGMWEDGWFCWPSCSKWCACAGAFFVSRQPSSYRHHATGYETFRVTQRERIMLTTITENESGCDSRIIQGLQPDFSTNISIPPALGVIMSRTCPTTETRSSIRNPHIPDTKRINTETRRTRSPFNPAMRKCRHITCV